MTQTHGGTRAGPKFAGESSVEAQRGETGPPHPLPSTVGAAEERGARLALPTRTYQHVSHSNTSRLATHTRTHTPTTHISQSIAALSKQTAPTGTQSKH